MKILKWIAIILAVLLLIVLIFATSIYSISESHRNQIFEIEAQSVIIDYDDPGLVEKGKHVATIRGCVDCHGEKLGGEIFIEDPVVGRLVATNLTSGEGGIGAEYTDEDFVKAIRHGVRKDGKSVIFMPSHEYNVIDSDDLAALIAYIRSMEPVDNILPDHKIGFIFRMLYVMQGEIHLFPARQIDHSLPIPEPVPDRTGRILGEYVATTCTGCHGANFSGGPIPGVPPTWPVASNLTPAGPLVDYSAEDFISTMRTGVTPAEHTMEAQYMPWVVFGQMTDEELLGLFEYLQSLPPTETGKR
jgi:mono/diheme cytochrome c family protein